MSKIPKILQKKEVRSFWKKIEEIVLKEYEEIKSMSMRDSYYHVADILAEQMSKNIVSKREWDYFQFDSVYFYYTQDKWSSWEKKHNILRPTTKNITIMIENGRKKLLPDDIHEVYFRAQGFIYLEKEGKAEDLTELSHYGWIILGAQGQSQRLLREILDQDTDKKPILVFHDADQAGQLIHDVFINGSRRTTHLDLKFENVIDLGLTLDDAKELNLQLSPDPKGGLRAEINSLIVLKRRMGIQNPFLWFVTKKMKELGIALTPRPISKKRLLEMRLRFQLEESLFQLIDKVVKERCNEAEDKEIIDIEFDDYQNINIENDDILEKLRSFSKELVKSARDILAPEIEKMLLETANKKTEVET